MLRSQLQSTLKDIKNPERRLFYLVSIIAISVLFSILINVLSTSSNNYKGKNEQLQNELNETVTRDNKIIDSLKDKIFNDKLNYYIEKDNYSKQLDSLINKLQKIK